MKRRLFVGLRSLFGSKLPIFHNRLQLSLNRDFYSNVRLLEEEPPFDEEKTSEQRYMSDEEWEEFKNEWDEEDDAVWEDFSVKDDPPSDHFAIGIFTNLLGLAVGWIAYRIYRTIMNHRESLTWKRVKGEITNTLLVGRSGDKIKLSYKYVVDNKIYRGKRIRFRIVPIMDGKLNMKSIKIGKKVWVYYDEESPSDCVLVPTEGIFYPDVALFAMVAALSLAFVGFGGRRFFYGLRTMGKV